MKVHVYRNLHKRCWSIRQQGIVIGHARSVILRDVTSHVQPAGREKVLLEGRKNVHAYLKGELLFQSDHSAIRHVRDRKITYNPYAMDTFRFARGGKDFVSARFVLLNDEGAFVTDHPIVTTSS